MNVLFISVDDMNNDLSCFGNGMVHSPGIDRLSDSGVTFTNAYCQFPLCNPSRASVMTGLRPDALRVFDLQYHFRQELQDIVTLPQMFKNNGYYVARVGKIYHYGNPGDIGTNGLDDNASWMDRVNPSGLDHTSLELDVINYTSWKKGLGAAMAYYSDAKGTDKEHTDGIVASEAIKLMEKHQDEPFFIAAGFYRPHTPWITPDNYFHLYDIQQMKLPDISSALNDEYPKFSLASTKPWPYLGLTEGQARECKLAYYASISFVDAQIGRLLEAVDRLGLTENTIIVFWSDHGYLLGEHGLWFKQSLFEESAKTPLIISAPGMNGNGKSCKRVVELVDVYPTLAALAGLTPPADLQGRNLSPLLRNPEAQWEEAAYTQVQRGKIPGHSVRTERWRYTEWNYGKDGVELYDELNDPQELKNLADDPMHAGVAKQLSARLHKMHAEKVEGGKADPKTKSKYCN